MTLIERKRLEAGEADEVGKAHLFDSHTLLPEQFGAEIPMAYCEWANDPDASTRTQIAFRLLSAGGELNDRISLELDPKKGYCFTGPAHIRIKQGPPRHGAPHFLYDYPLVRPASTSWVIVGVGGSGMGGCSKCGSRAISAQAFTLLPNRPPRAA